MLPDANEELPQDRIWTHALRGIDLPTAPVTRQSGKNFSTSTANKGSRSAGRKLKVRPEKNRENAPQVRAVPKTKITLRRSPRFNPFQSIREKQTPVLFFLASMLCLVGGAAIGAAHCYWISY